MCDLTAIILVYNEEKHIERCIRSIMMFANRIVVVDSYSSDNTVKICKNMNVDIFYNKWVNYSRQFNWAIENCDIKTEWVLRIDADEYFTKELSDEIMQKLCSIENDVDGIYMNRRLYFMNKWLRYGDRYPIKLLRIWRNGKGYVEDRWMDEHVKLLGCGCTMQLKNDFCDKNEKNLSDYIAKHNSYSSREALDVLNQRYKLFEYDTIVDNEMKSIMSQDKLKRLLKTGLYNRFPLYLRPILFFIYKYIFRLGFLDGKEGFIHMFMNVLWYRMLVDAKIDDIENKGGKQKDKIAFVLKNDYGLNI